MTSKKRGFAINPELAVTAGAKGGRAFRPKPKHFVMYEGKKMSVVDYARATGQDYSYLLRRLKAGGGLV